MCRHRLIRNRALLYDAVLGEDIEAYHDAFFRHYYELLSQGVTKDAFVFLLRALSGFRVDEIPALVEAIIRDQGTTLDTETYLGVPITKGLCVRKSVAHLLQECLDRKMKVFIISASPEVLVRAALQQYKLPFTDCFGICLKESEGVYMNETLEPMPVEDGKIVCLQEKIHPTVRPILAVGDSMNDFSLLTYAHIRVAVDRKNGLSDEARKNKWHILPYAIE